MRFIANTAEWDRSLLNVMLGQSGQVLSRHYTDHWEDYYYGRGKELAFSNYAGRTIEFKPSAGR